jgi:hypothetical protein
VKNTLIILNPRIYIAAPTSQRISFVARQDNLQLPDYFLPFCCLSQEDGLKVQMDMRGLKIRKIEIEMDVFRGEGVLRYERSSSSSLGCSTEIREFLIIDPRRRPTLELLKELNDQEVRVQAQDAFIGTLIEQSHFQGVSINSIHGLN